MAGRKDGSNQNPEESNRTHSLDKGRVSDESNTREISHDIEEGNKDFNDEELTEDDFEIDEREEDDDEIA